MAIIDPNELYHHGVKGMKWGVRRAQKRSARDSKKLAKLHSDVYNAHTNMVRYGLLKKDSKGNLSVAYARKRDNKAYAKAVKKANKYMDKLEKRYKDPKSREVRTGWEKMEEHM